VLLYSFSVTLDDDDCLERCSSSESEEAAIQEGCDILMGLVYLLRPAIARCVVYRGDGDTRPLVGTWSYGLPSPVPVWSACDD
jgi:hypothetical protein